MPESIEVLIERFKAERTGPDGARWEAEFRKFMSQVPNWGTPLYDPKWRKSLTAIKSFPVPALAEFRPQKDFVIESASVKLSSSFRTFLQGSDWVENPVEAATVIRARSKFSSFSSNAVVELIDPKKLKMQLSQVFFILTKFLMDELDVFLVQQNIFYISDPTGNLSVITASEFGNACWYVDVWPLTRTFGNKQDGQFFFVL